jgi:hypothetical protein
VQALVDTLEGGGYSWYGGLFFWGYYNVYDVDNGNISFNMVGLQAGSDLGTIWSQSASTSIAPSSFIAGSPSAAFIETAYSYQFQCNGAPLPAYSASGSLPPGLSLSSDGILAGTPTMSGNYTFSVTASNASGSTSTGSLSMNILTAASNLLPSNSVTIPMGPASLFSVGGATANLSIITSQLALSASSLYLQFTDSTGYPYIQFSSPTTLGARVSQGTTYTVIASAMISSGTTGIAGGTESFVWYTATGNYLSSSSGSGSYAGFSSTKATQLSTTQAAPANAAYACVQINIGQTPVSGDSLYIGHLGIYEGPSQPTWSA